VPSWWSRLSRNAKWLVVTEPGWSIPMPWVFFYLPVYLSALGVGEVEYGMYLSIARGLSIVAPALVVPIAVSMGFKRAFLAVDTLANVGFLLLLLSGSRELAALSVVLSALFSVSGPLWEVLLVEGAGAEALVPVYSALTAMYIVGSLLTPIAGHLMYSLGSLEGFRLVSLVALAAFVAKTLVLAVALEEPGAPGAEAGAGVAGGLRETLKAASGRAVRAVLAYMALSSTLYAVSSYLSLYLCDPRGVGMTAEEAGFAQMLSSAVSLALLTALTVGSTAARAQHLAATAAAGVVAYVLFALSEAQPSLAYVAAAVLGVKGLEYSFSRAVFLRAFEGSSALARGHAFSLLYALSNLVTVPTPLLVGLLYSVKPTLIWVLAAAASAAQLALSSLASRD